MNFQQYIAAHIPLVLFGAKATLLLGALRTILASYPATPWRNFQPVVNATRLGGGGYGSPAEKFCRGLRSYCGSRA